MWVIPVGARTIQNGKRRAPRLTAQDLLVRPAIVLGRHMEPVPVRRAVGKICTATRSTKVIRHIDHDLVPLVHHQGRTEEIPVVAQRGCLFARDELSRSGLHDQIVGYLPIDHIAVHGRRDGKIPYLPGARLSLRRGRSRSATCGGQDEDEHHMKSEGFHLTSPTLNELRVMTPRIEVYPGFPVSAGLRFRGRPKRDGDIIIWSFDGGQILVSPIEDAIPVVGHPSCAF